jgi:acyl-coenzyme A synthetase/AMP-(fatty) acid ligase
MQFGLSESVAHWGRYRKQSRAVFANGRAITYGELNADIDRAVPALLRDKAKRVAVAGGSKYNLLVAILAGLRAGKGIVVLNPGLADAGLQTNIADANATLLLHDGQVPRIAAMMEARGGRLVSLEGDKKATGKPVVFADRRPKDEWGVLYSSGTTGTPKGIERDHDSMVTEFLGWVIELGLSRQTIFFIGRPIYYTGGLVLVGATLIVGGMVVLEDLSDENDVEQTWNSLAKSLDTIDVDWAFFVPDQVRAFLKTLRSPTLRRTPENLLVMGGPINAQEKLAAASLLKCNVIESWGNSESLGTITEAEDLSIRPDSIGRPFVCDELLIVNEKLRPLGAGVPGRIAGGIEAGFSRYSNRPKETSKARRKKLIISEDYGTQDEDGYFYILGRLSDNVIRNGESVFLSQIESRLRTDTAVKDCCVTSAGGEDLPKIVAIVTPQPENLDSQSEAAMLARLNDTLSSKDRIDRVMFCAVPKLPSGKTDRVQCKRMAEDRASG